MKCQYCCVVEIASSDWKSKWKPGNGFLNYFGFSFELSIDSKQGVQGNTMGAMSARILAVMSGDRVGGAMNQLHVFVLPLHGFC